MTLQELYGVLEREVAPKSLSDEYCAKYDAYDNSGILIDCGKDVEKVLFALDFSAVALERAIEFGANVIVTHHPVIYGKIGNLRVSDPAGKNLLTAIRHDISIISMHLNFDCAKEGIDHWLMRGVNGGEDVKGKILEPLQAEGCGYGRVFNLTRAVTASELCENMNAIFQAEKTICYNGDKNVRRAVVFCGAGASESGVIESAKNGADVIVSSDFKHHIITMALEYGMAVIVPTHYAAECYGFEKIYQKVKEKIAAESCFFRDERLV